MSEENVNLRLVLVLVNVISYTDLPYGVKLSMINKCELFILWEIDLKN